MKDKEKKVVVVIRADGTTSVVDKPLKLEQWQALVGGPIELTQFAGFCVVLHEEGRIRDLPKNPIFPMYRGTVLFCRKGLGGLREQDLPKLWELGIPRP